MSLDRLNKNRNPFGKVDLIDKDTFYFGDFFASKPDFPGINVNENRNNYEFELAIPGFSKEEIEVSIENESLIISAEKKLDKEDLEGDLTHIGFSCESFRRKLPLSSKIDPNAIITATYQEGILRVVLSKNKTTNQHPKRIIEVFSD